MEESAFEDGEGEVEGAAAVGEEGDVGGVDDSMCVECQFIVGLKWMSFSGELHVIIFCIDEAGGAMGDLGDDCGHGSGGCGLGFFSAETAAHALAGADNVITGDTEDFGDNALDFGRVLGGGVNLHFAVFPGDGEGGLRFEIKMVLTADIKCAGEDL